MITTYDESIGYDAAIPYDGMDMTPPSSGGCAEVGNLRYITSKPPKKKVRNFKADEEAALIAWFMDNDE